MSYSEVKSLPIRYRRWYLDRLVKHFNDKNEAANKETSPNQDQSGFLEFEKQISSKFK
jgi:hypothetical protein